MTRFCALIDIGLLRDIIERALASRWCHTPYRSPALLGGFLLLLWRTLKAFERGVSVNEHSVFSKPPSPQVSPYDFSPECCQCISNYYPLWSAASILRSPIGTAIVSIINCSAFRFPSFTLTAFLVSSTSTTNQAIHGRPRPSSLAITSHDNNPEGSPNQLLNKPRNFLPDPGSPVNLPSLWDNLHPPTVAYYLEGAQSSHKPSEAFKCDKLVTPEDRDPLPASRDTTDQGHTIQDIRVSKYL